MRPQRNNTPIVLWLGLGVLALALLIPPAAFFHRVATEERGFTPAKRKRVVSVQVSPQQRRRPPEPELVPPPEPPKEEGIHVTVREPEKEQRPPRRTKHLSNADTNPEREVKARPDVRRSRRRGAVARRESRVQSAQSQSTQETATPETQPTPEIPAQQTVRAPEAESATPKPPESVLSRARQSRALMPSVDSHAAVANLQAITGGAATDDWLPHVREEGNETLIASRKFQHWDFFNTVKERVRKHWHPAPLYRRRDPTGKVYGIKDRLTVVRVTLDSTGNLRRLTIVKDSGVEFLDNEATRALRQAAPFMNPPEGLINRHHVIEFQFGFLFEISTSRYRFFRM